MVEWFEGEVVISGGGGGGGGVGRQAGREG